MSTDGTVSVPYAIAATACAPPMAKTLSTSAILAAARTVGSGRPSLAAGEHKITSLTPATRAGIAVISTVEGNGTLPPGT